MSSSNRCVVSLPLHERVESRRAIQEVFRSTPIDKQVMMFTATLPPETKAVCLKFMKDVAVSARNDD